MVTEEVGGRQFYDRHGAMPHFPGVASGVTIGVGYDLRFQEADDFEADWSGILTPAQMAALRPHLGKPGSPAACAALGDLHIPFSAAWQVFVTCALPAPSGRTPPALATYPPLPPPAAAP